MYILARRIEGGGLAACCELAMKANLFKTCCSSALPRSGVAAVCVARSKSQIVYLDVAFCTEIVLMEATGVQSEARSEPALPAAPQLDCASGAMLSVDCEQFALKWNSLPFPDQVCSFN